MKENIQFADCLIRSEVNFAELPPFLRVLLSTDGTVTKSLEAYFWEPIAVVTDNQGSHVLTVDEPHLNLECGAEVLQRKVELRGANSKKIFAYADSIVRTQVLPMPVRRGLEGGELGVGELLRECGLETYRKIIELGSAVHVQAGPCIWRSYIIAMERQPFIKIKEQFPIVAFKS